jgi:arginyl-tRNA synthetase
MKFKNHNFIYNLIAKSINDCLKASENTAAISDEYTLDKIYGLLSTPPKANMGDVAFACFPLAKALKNAPNKIANELAETIEVSETFLEIKAFGPYLNFFLNPSITNKIILEKINDQSYFKESLIDTAPKTIIEYSQPNTHKIMHVGHMRNLCLGNAIVSLYKYAGIETLSTTFPGDVGTHVAKCLWYYKKYNTEEIPTQRKGAWIGKMYTKGNTLLEDEKGTPKEDENRKELTLILKQLHAGEGEYFDLWKETREWSIELMNEVYKWAKVEFDSWYWESDVDSTSVDLVNEYLKKGLFIKDDGAVGIDLSEDKLGFCLLLKSDGTGLYATKDLELARRKFIDQKVEKSIYVVDNRQSLHFKQVFKTLEKMGFENAKDCYHLQYEMVELTDGAMSSRKGNIVPMQALIEEMVTVIKEQHLGKYQDEWSPEKIHEVANTVASGAIKYGMTRVDSNKKIIFDMKDWLKLDGESGPYIQYVYARINSLVNKIGTAPSVDYGLLNHKLEMDLTFKLSQLNTIIETCVSQNKTHPLCAYLYDLAKSFNSFYAECSVAKAETEELKYARVELCKAVANNIKHGLGILGIDSPEQM